MSNLIRKTIWAVLKQPIFIVKEVEETIDGIPCFSELEFKWMSQYVNDEAQAKYLYLARLEDPNYQIAPDELLRRPPDPEPTVGAKAAKEKFFEFVDKTFRQGSRNTGS
jgi:hypothetical protein